MAHWVKPRLPQLAIGGVFGVIVLGVAMCHSDSTASNTNTGKPTVTALPPSNAQAITHGKCLGAQGTQDAGVLHAMTISLEACPPMGHPHHHLHLPHFHI